MTLLHTLVALDEALSERRIQMERVLFRLNVVRLAGTAAPADCAARFMARLESEAAGAEGSGTSGEFDAPGAVRDIAESAPEPYRTMLLSHLERVERILAEIDVGSHSPPPDDPLDVLAGEIAYQAARGALAGAAAPFVSAFVRNRDARPHVA